ncbi:MAG: sulfurtransferase [Gammaproteobacteria bacterium]|jgi:thiosulfate/3-mercaptopyruvate sulfurtransferase
MEYSTVIGSNHVYQYLDDPHWRIVDCRFNLQDPDHGRGLYALEHLPNAVYAHLDDDLSSPITVTSGRHPLPDIESFKATLGRWGIDADTQVVAYDDAGGSYAARLWWLLQWLGHKKVAVLDGGFSVWKKQGLPVTAEQPRITATEFHGEPQPGMNISTEQLQQQLTQSQICLIDVRDPERFEGTTEPIDDVAGHIPGAINMPWKQNVDDNGLFLPKSQLYDYYKKLLRTNADRQLILMCGSGVTACHGLLALSYIGESGGKLYPGSWSEWIRDPDRPVKSVNQ